MTYDDIVNAILEKIRKILPDKPIEEKYKLWYVGITHDVKERRESHKNAGKNTVTWESWTAIDKETARRVEKHFLDLGMDPKEQRYNSDYNQNKVYVL